MSFHFSNSGYNNSNFNKGVSLLLEWHLTQHGRNRMSYLQIRQHRPYRPLVPERTREGLGALVPVWGLPCILEQLKDHTREELKVLTYIRTTLVPWTEPQQDGYLISGEKKSLRWWGKAKFSGTPFATIETYSGSSPVWWRRGRQWHSGSNWTLSWHVSIKA